ncbi:leucine-rich repeat-containing protein 4-like isoform X2 [Clavelina lepadiformis]|uniref:leucine-rich repeat-containing protein 4-like isoform X2 n=1 Tax=Clavelina lepadiformis TaxID=159417 RepID=UPI004042881E
MSAEKLSTEQLPTKTFDKRKKQLSCGHEEHQACLAEQLRTNERLKKNEYFITSTELDKQLTVAQCPINGQKQNNRKTMVNRNNRIQSRTGQLTSLLIMASTVWWCQTWDNCIKFAASEQIRCPADCVCTEEYQDTQCTNEALRTIPAEIPTRSRILSLSFNQITELQRNVFQRLTQLENLLLNENRISAIAGSAFTGLGSLQRLDLSGNRLKEVPKVALGDLNNLRELSLRNNPIKQILSYDFVRVGKTLSWLDIGQLRQLNHVSTHALNGLASLKTLSMDNCNLKDIPFLKPLPRLNTLDLSSNKMVAIRPSTFTGLNKLISLNLGYCDISDIDSNSFTDLVSLQNLNLANNDIAYMGSILGQNVALRFLQMHNNPWTCNCDLLQLAVYLSESSLCDGKFCGTCQSPPEYRGTSMRNFTLVDDLLCVGQVAKPPYTSLNVSVGDAVKIPCPTLSTDVAASENSIIKWVMPSGRTLSHGRYKVRIAILGNGSLNFTHVTLKDKGVYTCSISLPNNEVLQSTVYLNVTRQPRMSFTYFTTETTIVKNDDKISKIIRSTTTAKIRRTQTSSTASMRRSTQASSNRGTSVKTASLSIAMNRDNLHFSIRPLVPTTTTIIFKENTPESLYKVEKTSTIVTGCFISMTIVAAALVIIFNKVRKKSYSSSPQTSCNEKDEENDHTNINVDSHYHPSKKELSKNDMQRNLRYFLLFLTSLQFTCWILTSCVCSLNSLEESDRSNFASAVANRKNTKARLSLMEVHVLAPPSQFMTTPINEMTGNKKCNSTHSAEKFQTNKRYEHDQLPTTSSSSGQVSKQLLSSLARSGQKVALKKQSTYNCNNQVCCMQDNDPLDFNQKSSSLDFNKFQEDAFTISIPSYENTYKCDDTKNSKSPLTNGCRSKGGNEKSKRRIPIKIENGEEFLAHKESKI